MSAYSEYNITTVLKITATEKSPEKLMSLILREAFQRTENESGKSVYLCHHPYAKIKIARWIPTMAGVSIVLRVSVPAQDKTIRMVLEEILTPWLVREKQMGSALVYRNENLVIEVLTLNQD